MLASTNGGIGLTFFFSEVNCKEINSWQVLLNELRERF